MVSEQKPDRVPVWCRGENWCALKSVSKILNSKYVPVIIDRIGDDSLRFSEIKEEIDGITSKTLSNNLEKMQQRGLVDRKVETGKPVKTFYSLTEFGKQLIPLVEEMKAWAKENLEEGGKEEAWIA